LRSNVHPKNEFDLFGGESMQNQQTTVGQNAGKTPMAGVQLDTPPKVISGKDLSYLKDSMNWELAAVKKFHHFSQEAQNPQVKNELNRLCQTHEKHFQTLLKHLNQQTGM
jgi:hypothetical protein